jgi:hypothetical protein
VLEAAEVPKVICRAAVAIVIGFSAGGVQHDQQCCCFPVWWQSFLFTYSMLLLLLLLLLLLATRVCAGGQQQKAAGQQPGHCHDLASHHGDGEQQLAFITVNTCYATFCAAQYRRS